MTDSRRLAEELAGFEVQDRYQRQLNRLRALGRVTECITDAVTQVEGLVAADAEAPIVIFGDPQSGKTEMMICLTAKLLDLGFKRIVHLVTDNTALLAQSIDRFRSAGTNPAPRTLHDTVAHPPAPDHPCVVFCKKNSANLRQLIASLGGDVVVIDDEADFATPNSKVNRAEMSKIYEHVGTLLGAHGLYIGVTATPARLDLNNTFDAAPERWVRFDSHPHYIGPDVFFPPDGDEPTYRRILLDNSGNDEAARRAFLRFLITSAFLNTRTGASESNYSFLAHTSGRKVNHGALSGFFRVLGDALVAGTGELFEELIADLASEARELYPAADPRALLEYIVSNAPRITYVIINSSDKPAAVPNPAEPNSPFTIMVGGNIVSRGVTFDNLLAMYFTRDVSGKLQQDTYVQRARMFGSRGAYLEHFELTVPDALYAAWREAFDYQRLALHLIAETGESPIWIGSGRTTPVSSSSIDRTTVDTVSGEMHFGKFQLDDPAALDDVIRAAPTELATLGRVETLIGSEAIRLLRSFLEREVGRRPGTLAVHEVIDISNYGADVDQANLKRARGFIGTTQLQGAQFPNALHHVFVLRNAAGGAKVVYKNTTGRTFLRNLR